MKRPSPSSRSKPPLSKDIQELQAEILQGFESSGGSEEDTGKKAGAAVKANKVKAEDDDELSEAVVLEASGEKRLDDVKHLILRDRKLKSLATQRAVDFLALVSLEVLSLSRNLLEDITPLSMLVSLVEVNVNFNQIADLSPLFDCDSLLKLFASHNQVDTIAGLSEGCPNLIELSLFENRLKDTAEVTEVLRVLPKLRSLDIGHNDCCVAPSQRYGLLQALPSLEVLDSQKLSDMDRRLADDFFEEASKADAKGNQSADAGTPLAFIPHSLSSTVSPSPPPVGDPVPNRPSTAPSRPPPLPNAHGSSMSLLPGQKLRSSRANRIDDVLTRSREPSPDPGRGGSLPSIAPVDAPLEVDLRDPTRALPILMKHSESLTRRIETLVMDRENLMFQIQFQRQEEPDVKMDQLREEISRLKAENLNAFSVENERERLQARLKALQQELVALDAPKKPSESQTGGAVPRQDDNNDSQALELKIQNKMLEKRLTRMHGYLEQLNLGRLSAHERCGRSVRPATACATMPVVERSDGSEPGGDANADLEIDDELAELLATNESRLRETRCDLRDTATAVARKHQEAALAAAVPPSGHKPGVVDVLTIGEGQKVDAEWHG